MKRTLYFVTRNDLNPGRRAAQLIHAMDEWAARHGPHLGTVIVYAVRDEPALRKWWSRLGEDGALFCEPDLNHAATAFATAQGPLPLSLLH